MLSIGLGTKFTLDGIKYEVVKLYSYGPGVYVNSRRVGYPMAPLFEHGIGTLQFYRNNGRLKLCEE